MPRFERESSAWRRRRDTQMEEVARRSGPHRLAAGAERTRASGAAALDRSRLPPGARRGDDGAVRGSGTIEMDARSTPWLVGGRGDGTRGRLKRSRAQGRHALLAVPLSAARSRPRFGGAGGRGRSR